MDKMDFEALFKTHFAGLCRFANKYVEDYDASKDIVHAVFVNLWNKRDTIDANTSLKSYLFTSVHNRCLNHIRDQKKLVHHELPLEQTDMLNFVESRDFVEENETIDRINEAIAALPDKCREIFVMSRFDELKYREIAEKLDISVKTVETQVSRALKQLKESLKDLLFTLVILLTIILKHLSG
jgi:RNA polymerase sigma-70 factor (ECF subfamily)